MYFNRRQNNQFVNSLCRAPVKSGGWVVPVGTRHKELIFYIMEPLETHLKGIILSNLYRDPRKKRIQHDIMDELQTKLFPEQLISYRKQLVMEGLITEEEPDEVHSLVEITPKGYEAIQTFGSYQAYIADQQKAIKLQRESEVMKSRYLRLKTISIVITTLLSILSFITGILLSDLVKGIIK